MFVICGLNHKTAPLQARELFASYASQMLSDLMNTAFVEECVLLSTCNRTEFYCNTKNYDLLESWIINKIPLPANNIIPHLYLYTEQNAMLHALKVATGLDSMMIGEPQILGQIKQAYQDACENNYIKTKLHQVFQYIFKTSKNIRHTSGIGKNPISIASAATKLIYDSFKNYKNLKVMIIGSGETAALIAKYLYKDGIKNFTIANRTKEKAEILANKYEAQAISLNEITAYIKNTDIILSATSCPVPFIDKQFLINANVNSKNSTLFLMDLAIPRDISEDVLELNNIKLYNIDDLQNIIMKGQEARLLAAENATSDIHKELKKYKHWQTTLQAKNNICEYREQMQKITNTEFERSKKKLNKGENPEKVLEEFYHRILNKIMHEPSVYLRNNYEFIEE